jgi:hypothetical protein
LPGIRNNRNRVAGKDGQRRWRHMLSRIRCDPNDPRRSDLDPQGSPVCRAALARTARWRCRHGCRLENRGEYGRRPPPRGVPKSHDRQGQVRADGWRGRDSHPLAMPLLACGGRSHGFRLPKNNTCPRSSGQRVCAATVDNLPWDKGWGGWMVDCTFRYRRRVPTLSA